MIMFPDTGPETMRNLRVLTPEDVDRLSRWHDRDDYTAAERDPEPDAPELTD